MKDFLTVAEFMIETKFRDLTSIVMKFSRNVYDLFIELYPALYTRQLQSVR